MNRPILLGAILTLLIAVPVMANDLVFVAIPAIRGELGAASWEIQLAISSYLLSFAVVQLVYGPMSDHYGRRPVLIATLALFVAASVLCVIAQSLEMIVLGRVLQGLGGGSGPALARAVLRDVYGAERSGRILSYIMSLFGVVAIAAPVIGGGLTENFGWRTVFVFAAAYGVLCILLVWRCLEETVPAGPGRGVARRSLQSFATLLGTRVFVLLAGANMLIYGAMFVWLAGVAFVLIDAMRLGADEAGIWFAVSVSGFAVGSALAGRLGGRCAPLQLVLAGGGICLVAAAVGSVIALVQPTALAGLVVPGFAIMVGIGLAIPPATAAGIAPFPEMAGAASALIGFLQMAAAAPAVLVVGYLYDGSAFPMMLEMACLTAAGLAAFVPLASHMTVRVLPR